MHQALSVDAVVAVNVDGGGHSAHQIVGVGIFPAEDGVDLDDFLLPVQRLQIVRHGQQIHLRRQPVPGVSPIPVGENTQLPAVHNFLDLVLNVLEVARRGLGPLGDRLGQGAGGFGIGLQGIDHIHPIEGMQMIKMDHMVVEHNGSVHDFPDQMGVARDFDVQRILHGPDGSQGMGGGAHAADALYIRPHIPGVAVLHNQLQAADGRARAVGVLDHTVVYIRLNPQMAFNPRYRVYYDSFTHTDVPPPIPLFGPCPGGGPLFFGLLSSWFAGSSWPLAAACFFSSIIFLTAVAPA
ncbi:hypothetical protein D3C75_827470 [compost metagenome]